MARSEETQDSHSEPWTLSPLRRPTSTSESFTTSREDSNHTELTLRRLNSSSARSPKRRSARLRFLTSLPTTEEPSDSLTQTSKSTTPSSSTSRARTSAVSSSSRLDPPSCSSEETTSEELVTSLLLRSIQVPSTSAMSRTSRVTLSPPDSVTLSSLVMERPTPCPFLRETVSDSLLSKRETPEEVTRRTPATTLKRMTSDQLCLPGFTLN